MVCSDTLYDNLCLIVCLHYFLLKFITQWMDLESNIMTEVILEEGQIEMVYFICGG